MLSWLGEMIAPSPSKAASPVCTSEMRRAAVAAARGAGDLLRAYWADGREKSIEVAAPGKKWKKKREKKAKTKKKEEEEKRLTVHRSSRVRRIW